MPEWVSDQRIDRFIEAMHRKGADQLVFGTGHPVRIRVHGSERVILDKQVRTDQIKKLLSPISEVIESGERSFEYEAPSGPVTVRTHLLGEKLSAIITPYREPERASTTDGSPPSGIDEIVAAAEMASGTEAEPLEEETPLDAQIPVAVDGEPEINRILRQLVREGASDLHLTAGQRPMVRKDGAIRNLPGWDVLDSATIERWMAAIAHETATESFYGAHDADFAHEIESVSRFRVNWFRDRNGVGGVMRTIPTKILTADDLHLPPVIRQMCELQKGLVVVTGPTGSGKSTTLAAMVDLINRSRTDHIITIEDPVEFVHASQRCLVNQREVHTHTESFATALRAALREDPDIVLVGEMRDLETVHIAIETAETGHLVFGTLHTNTAPSTVDRIIDQFPTDHQAQIRVMLSESLKGVIAQTLCKKKGGGRVACFEILVVNSAVSNLIREGKTFQIPSIMQTAKGQGMQTQSDHMLQLVKAGTVEPLEAFKKAADQTTMKQLLERAGHPIDA